MEDENYLKKLKSKQLFFIFLCFLVYSIAQIGRYSYTANVNYIISYYSVSKADAALPTTLFFFGYAIGQIINGIFCRKMSKKVFLTTGLVISASCNLILFLNIPFELFKFVWLANGISQSFFWVLLMLSLGEKVDKKYSSQIVILMSCAPAFGTLLTYGLSSLLSTFNVSNYIFLIGFIGSMIMAITWLICCLNKNSVINLSSCENQNEETKEKNKKNAAPLGIIFYLIVVFSIVAALSYSVSGSLKSWAPAIFKEIYFLNDNISIMLSVILPLVAMLNGVVCNFFYKKIKSITFIIFFFMLVALLLLFILIGFINVSWVLSLFLIIGVFSFTGMATNALTVQAPIYLKTEKMSSGFLAGIFNGFCYLGNALATFVMGLIVDNSSWINSFYFLAILCAIALPICISFWILKALVYGKKNYKIGENL